MAAMQKPIKEGNGSSEDNRKPPRQKEWKIIWACSLKSKLLFKMFIFYSHGVSSVPMTSQLGHTKPIFPRELLIQCWEEKGRVVVWESLTGIGAMALISSSLVQMLPSGNAEWQLPLNSSWQMERWDVTSARSWQSQKVVTNCNVFALLPVLNFSRQIHYSHTYL